MPGLRENIKETLEKSENISENVRSYSKRSPIRKAYEAGVMPIDHQRLLEAIKNELDNVSRG